MESLDSEPCFMDDLLNFSSDMDEEDDRPKRALASSSSFKPNGLLAQRETVRPFHELVEEELEWISNKDAFPAVESFVGILSDHHPIAAAPASKHHSPVSVLDGSTVTVISAASSNGSNCHSSGSAAAALASCFAPRRARSQRRRRRRRGDISGRQLCWSQQQQQGNAGEKAAKKQKGGKCQHCGAEKTPQWRAGPNGPKTLCNACGVRFKSGRLVPEYRPASSPSFSGEIHSNLHRKILEMRRVKQVTE